MFWMLFAAALAGEPAPLDLELWCPGQYQDTETSTAHAAGDVTARATIETAVMRPGTAQVRFRGSEGELVYPDGRHRALTNVIADERSITAQYVRRTMLIPFTWKLIIDRRSGDIRVSNGGDVGFLGNCSAAPTKPKF